MKTSKIKKLFIIDNFLTILLSILPIAIIIGPAFINILLTTIILFFFFNKSNWGFLKNKYFFFLLIFFLYLIINTFLSKDPLLSIVRVLSFIKFTLFSLALASFINTNINREIMFKTWLIIIFIIIIDVYFEKFFGKNIIGLISSDPQRVASFFNEELIVGSFLFAFSFLVFSIFFKKKVKIYWSLILILGLAIFLSGERAVFLKYLVYIFIIMLLFEKRLSFFKKIIFFFIFVLLIAISLKLFISTKDRQSLLLDTLLSKDHKNTPLTVEEFKNNLYKIKHFAHYDTAWKIFKDNPFFGSGLKTYRVECSNPDYFNSNIIQSEVRCTTHPHQIHFELLSELGIIGYLMFLLFFFYFLYAAIKQYIKNKEIILLNSTIYIFISLIPIIPSGSFFGTVSGVFFFTNFGFILSFLIKKK